MSSASGGSEADCTYSTVRPHSSHLPVGCLLLEMENPGRQGCDVLTCPPISGRCVNLACVTVHLCGGPAWHSRGDVRWAEIHLNSILT